MSLQPDAGSPALPEAAHTAGSCSPRRLNYSQARHRPNLQGHVAHVDLCACFLFEVLACSLMEMCLSIQASCNQVCTGTFVHVVPQSLHAAHVPALRRVDKLGVLR